MSNQPISTHDVILAAVGVHQGMRTKFIELQGMPVIYRKLINPTRVDEMGDVINEFADSDFSTQEIRAVFNLARYFHITASIKNGTYENGMTLDVSIDLQLEAHPGDRILFTQRLLPVLQEDKLWQIASVEQQLHMESISKKIKLVPLRDV